MAATTPEKKFYEEDSSFFLSDVGKQSDILHDEDRSDYSDGDSDYSSDDYSSDEEDDNVLIADPGTTPKGKYGNQVIFEGQDGKSYIRNFKDVKVSTMTLIASFEGRVTNLGVITVLLPVIIPKNPKEVHSPGTITSARWKGIVRGEVGKWFKNSIIINIHTKGKKISAKLSPFNIQMAGPTSEDMGMEAAQHISSEVKNILALLDKINQDPEKFILAGEWLLKNCLGEEVKVKRVIEEIMIESETIPLESVVSDNYISWPKDIPQELNFFVQELIKRCTDLFYVQDVKNKIDFLNQRILPDSVSTPLQIKQIGRCMVNRNYHLGFEVNRLELVHYLNEVGIDADFINIHRPHATVKMRSDIPSDGKVVRRSSSDKGDNQTFLIYFSGHVLHSGPGGEMMEDCYYQFMYHIAKAGSRIKKK